MKKIKILHLLTSNKFSGAENVVCQIIDMFKNDCEVEMIYCSPDGPIKNVLKERNINYLPIKNLNYMEIRRALELYKPDIIHSHDFKASIYSSFFKDKIIISHIHQSPKWINSINIYSIMYAITSLKFKKIISVSDVFYKKYIFRKIIENKYLEMMNVVNGELIIELSNEFDCNEIDLIYVGRLSKEKNPFKFIDIVNCVKRKIPGINAVIIGNGDLKEECLSKINKLKLNKNIRYLGFQKNPFPYIKNSKLLIMPSDYEGFGLVAVESLILNTPVICSGAGGLAHLIDDSIGKICNSLEDYVNQIVFLLKNSNELYKLKNNIITYYKIKKFVDLNNYKKIIKKIYTENL